ncbi:hypothetical protein KBB96_09905 [Luteolibacter ambystomatis]|uniref:Uncharacterized protein n=1 Tax=Luteolibacter ambystomatis TaxID=2824561 RepID=A0A975J361_9BACT|nr:hypothetical protein [Luteolibacter ambystomatis]QUE53195.1 hypothetical protein KBB96_09905 [Luteolibacter ambystomatis]
MSSVIYEYTCASCGTEFKASGVPEMSYGEFVLRTKSGEESYLEAIGNPAFNEVWKLVESHPSLAHTDPNRLGEITQKIFGPVCDLSPTGQIFHVGIPPACPICSSHKMASWRESRPLQLSPIPSATQNRWESLDESKKAAVIDEAIRDLS